jgi:translation initiation factor 2 alpha subunit (eIF-2alpha)
MPEEDLLILDKIKNTTVEEAFKILMPYLENKYENNKEFIDSTAKEIKTILDLQKDEVFKVLEKLTKHPIEYKEIKIRLTTLNRCPYIWET